LNNYLSNVSAEMLANVSVLKDFLKTSTLTAHFTHANNKVRFAREEQLWSNKKTT